MSEATVHLRESAVRWDVPNLELLALQIRQVALDMVAPQGFGYLGQALSSAEQIAAVFARIQPGTDRLVCSPGHYIIGPFAAAVAVGAVPQSAVEAYGKNGSEFEAIGTEYSPVVDYTCGSLGQGLSAAAGFALSARMRGSDATTFAFVSDGELEEGQVWEAALFAAHYRLRRMTVLVDANNSQVDGAVDTITTLEPIADKWAAFGWHVQDIDGHSIGAVASALDAARDSPLPSVVICRTSTAHGIDALPRDADGHFIKLPPDLAAAAAAELSEKARSIHA